jgi:hypothetical protein
VFHTHYPTLLDTHTRFAVPLLLLLRFDYLTIVSQ